MNEYLYDLDYQSEHRLLLKGSIIFVLRFPVVYHEVLVEEQERLELGLKQSRSTNFTTYIQLSIPDGRTAKIGVNSVELRT